MVDKVNYSRLWMLHYVTESRCAGFMVDKVNCDTKFCDWDPSYQMRLYLQVRFKLFLSSQVEARQTPEW